MDESERKDELINKVLALWKEDPVQGGGDERLKQELIEKEDREYSEESRETLEKELPGAVRGIEFFIAMYD